VVAAGERWPDGSLRPAVEDLWGAGAVLSGLTRGSLSPEAAAAVAAYDVVRDRLVHALPDCASGRELVAAGFGGDVDVAAARDVSRVVPLLYDDAFGDGSS
jgi:2-phosphosulfolactate phosphatase